MQNLLLKGNGVSEGTKDYFGVIDMVMTMDAPANNQRSRLNAF
jgi:hypothetical protein